MAAETTPAAPVAPVAPVVLKAVSIEVSIEVVMVEPKVRKESTINSWIIKNETAKNKNGALASVFQC